MLNKKKYSCVFCSDTNEKSSKVVFFCRECSRIRNYIRDNGIKTLLTKIEGNNKASAPPLYNTNEL